MSAEKGSGGEVKGGIVDCSTHEFIKPKKEISLPDDMPKWLNSQPMDLQVKPGGPLAETLLEHRLHREFDINAQSPAAWCLRLDLTAYDDLMGCLMALNAAVKGKKISDTYHVSQEVENVVEIIKLLDGWIEGIPPIDQPQRFGNKAFRTYFKKLEENADSIIRDHIGEKYEKALPELSTYLTESIGNYTRIDYGTGHEMAFAVFICCLFKIGYFKEEDTTAVTLRIFEPYLHFVRNLQLTYRMEPAGSQGVWSLDDFQFIPFIWGSSQLIGHPRIQPKSITKTDIIEYFSKDYMFLGCIKYINKVKTGPFAEHSNQLWNISAVGTWDKVNSGLVKMYKAEVLGKFPVVQHVLFGSLMSIQPTEKPS